MPKIYSQTDHPGPNRRQQLWYCIWPGGIHRYINAHSALRSQKYSIIEEQDCLNENLASTAYKHHNRKNKFENKFQDHLLPLDKTKLRYGDNPQANHIQHKASVGRPADGSQLHWNDCMPCYNSGKYHSQCPCGISELQEVPKDLTGFASHKKY